MGLPLVLSLAELAQLSIAEMPFVYSIIHVAGNHSDRRKKTADLSLFHLAEDEAGPVRVGVH